jgi:hypothetical protein
MSAESTSGGIGLSGILTIIFVVLKLTGLISWPWLWVLSPLWISLLLFILLVVLVGFGALIVIALGLKK